MSRELIQEIALSKRIPFLVHFTRVENIPSIMQHGILPITIARERNLDPIINDTSRLDGRLNGTSLSIAFPNGSMFYRLRMENPNANWSILAISPSVLWSKDILFCKHNAADTRVSRLDSDHLRRPESFAAMFDEIEGIDSREAQALKDYDPTDVQGEVLVMDAIEPEFIQGALFNTAQVCDIYRGHFGRRNIIVHPGRKGFFANRTYYRRFGSG